MAGAETGVLEAPYQASAAVTRKRFVTLTGDQTVARVAAVGGKTLGVAHVSITDNTGVADTNGRNEITDGKGTAVHIHGIIFVESGAAVTRDADVMSDATGRVIDFVAGASGATRWVAGRALKGAAAAGEWVPVLLTPGVRVTTP